MSHDGRTLRYEGDADSEKISVRLDPQLLTAFDAALDESLYANRSDAIRELLREFVRRSRCSQCSVDQGGGRDE